VAAIPVAAFAAVTVAPALFTRDAVSLVMTDLPAGGWATGIVGLTAGEVFTFDGGVYVVNP
jgi:hypothetical protein